MVEIKPSNMFEFQHAIRLIQQDEVDLQIKRYVNDLEENIQAALAAHTQTNGIVESAAWILTKPTAFREIDKWEDRFSGLLEKGFSDAISIVAGAFAFYHNEHFLKAVQQAKIVNKDEAERFPFVRNWFENLNERLLEKARQRIYDNADGIKLSDRIWKIGRDQKKRLETLIFQAIADGKSIEEVSKEIAQLTGVIEWQALRLARNEIQTIYHECITETFSQMPFVSAVQMVITQERHRPDMCDSVRNSSEIGDGKFPIGKIKLPLHPNCMCYWRPILIGVGELTTKIKVWRNGRAIILPLSQYQSFLGGDISIRLDDEYFQKIYSWS